MRTSWQRRSEWHARTFGGPRDYRPPAGCHHLRTRQLDRYGERLTVCLNGCGVIARKPIP